MLKDDSILNSGLIRIKYAKHSQKSRVSKCVLTISIRVGTSQFVLEQIPSHPEQNRPVN